MSRWWKAGGGETAEGMVFSPVHADHAQHRAGGDGAIVPEGGCGQDGVGDVDGNRGIALDLGVDGDRGAGGGSIFVALQLAIRAAEYCVQRGGIDAGAGAAGELAAAGGTDRADTGGGNRAGMRGSLCGGATADAGGGEAVTPLFFMLVVVCEVGPVTGQIL